MTIILLMLTIILGLVFKSSSKIAQDCPDLLLPRLQPPCSQHVLQPRIHARVGPVPGGAPGVVITVVQLGHAGTLQLRQQHHGAHHEPVRCSVVFTVIPGIAATLPAFRSNPLYSDFTREQ